MEFYRFFNSYFVGFMLVFLGWEKHGYWPASRDSGDIFFDYVIYMPIKNDLESGT